MIGNTSREEISYLVLLAALVLGELVTIHIIVSHLLKHSIISERRVARQHTCAYPAHQGACAAR